LNSKINSKPLLAVDFASRFAKEVRKNFEQIKITNLDAKSTDEMDFEPIFGFKALSI
jgi:hypothetical protein